MCAIIRKWEITTTNNNYRGGMSSTIIFCDSIFFLFIKHIIDKYVKIMHFFFQIRYRQRSRFNRNVESSGRVSVEIGAFTIAENRPWSDDVR